MWENVAMAAVVIVPIAAWSAAIALIYCRSRPPKPPKSTPWADSTKVAEEVRAKHDEGAD